MCNQPATSVDAATSTGAGSAIDLGHSYAWHTAVVWTTGSPSVTVLLEFSHDGMHWASFNNASGGSSPFSVLTNRVARYVRANVTEFSGGTSPTVTVTIASA